MSRGRKQKWYCRDCKAEFEVQKTTPKLCCSCGSHNIGRTPTHELSVTFEEKKKELEEVSSKLAPAYEAYMDLKARYDSLANYWRQQYKRGFITKEELEILLSSNSQTLKPYTTTSDSSKL